MPTTEVSSAGPQITSGVPTTTPAGVVPRSGVDSAQQQASHLRSPSRVESAFSTSPETPTGPNYQTGFEAGRERGQAEGKLEILSEIMEQDVTRIGSVIEQHGSTNQKQEWRALEKVLTTELNRISHALETGDQQFDPMDAARDLALQLKLLGGYGELARTLEQPRTAATTVGGAPLGGDLTVKHGDIIALDLYDRVFKPWIDRYGSALQPSNGEGTGNVIFDLRNGMNNVRTQLRQESRENNAWRKAQQAREVEQNR